jgi:thiol-disulfide isomerase/thioredoxin
MANLIDVVTKLIRPYYYRIITVVLIILFIVVGYYGYNTIVNKEKNKFKDVANENRRNKEAPVYFFHVDWCPHCKKALPEWKKFASTYDGKEINGYLIKCYDVDCTNETSDVTVFINKYKIESYPTVKLIRDDNTIDFDSRITSSSLDQFVNTMLN